MEGQGLEAVVPQGQKQGAAHHLFPVDPEELGGLGVEVNHLAVLVEDKALQGFLPGVGQRFLAPHPSPASLNRYPTPAPSPGSGGLGVFPEFFPQLEDVLVHGPGGAHEVLAPHGLQKLLPGVDPAWAACQKGQEFKLPPGEGKGPPFQARLHALQVQEEGPPFEDLALARPAQEGLEAGQELLGGEGLDQVIVRSPGKPLHPVPHLGPGGEHEDGEVGVRPLAHPLQEAGPRLVGEHPVQDHHLGLFKEIPGLLGQGGLEDPVARPFQGKAHP